MNISNENIPSNELNLTKMYNETTKIPYLDENGITIDHLNVEITEQRQAWNYVPKDATVLELGARYGTVSCEINKKLNNPTRQVSVEPDPRVLPALIKNKSNHECQFTIYDGVISKKPMTLHQDNFNGYGNYTVPSFNSNVKSTTLENLIKETGLQFDTLVADCEGFLEQFFDENRDYIPKFNVVMFEKDYPYRCNYGKIEQYLVQLGFRCVNQVGDMHVVYSKNY